MVAILPTRQSQFFRPIPAIGQNIELAGYGQTKTLKHPFRQGDFRLEAPAAFSPLRMIETSPKRQERLLIEERCQNPLVAKNIGQVLGVILIPATAGDFLSCLFDNRIVQKKKDKGASLNLEAIEEFLESHPQDFIQGPGILSQESGETGERPGEEGSRPGLDHGRGVSLFSQLDEAHNMYWFSVKWSFADFS
jgi:hypothetical protein